MNFLSLLATFVVTFAMAQTNVSAQTTTTSLRSTARIAAMVTAAPTPPPTAGLTKPMAACERLSVEGDAIYCIQGPICSGNGAAPAGLNCPLAGDVAVDRCNKTMKSYTDAGKCVAPTNSECKKSKTGSWGCVLAPAVAAKAVAFSGSNTIGSSSIHLVYAMGLLVIGALFALIAAVVWCQRKQKNKDAQDDQEVQTP